MNQQTRTSGLTRAWSDFYRQLVEKFMEVLDWSFSQKVLFLSVLLLVYHVGLLALWEMSFAPGDAVLNYTPLRLLQLIWISLLIGMIVVSMLMYRAGSQAEWPAILGMSLYLACVVLNMYGFGTLSSYAAAIFIGALAVALVGFGAKTILIMTATSSLLVIGILFAESSGLIPYAPFWKTREVGALNDPRYAVVVFCTFMALVLQTMTMIQLSISARRHSERKWIKASTVIRRYLPPAVADCIIDGDDAAIDTPQRRRITVLFADIVGFTNIADRVEPEITTQVISEYLSAMADLIEQHGGTLNEFAGDGLMALFGAPNELEPRQQARQAILSAQTMQRKMSELNAHWQKLGLGGDLKIRIGINTGVLSVGSFGSAGRMTYTAIGLQTNVTARIQARCEPGSILVSEASWQLIKDEIECTSEGVVEVKGVHFPISVYRPAT